MAEDDDLLIRQVQEEMRRERLENLWQQYGTYFVAGAVAIVAGVGGFKFWESQAEAAREAAGAKYVEATQKLGEEQTAEAAAAFEEIVAGGADGYKALAQMQLAAAKLNLKKPDEAAKALDSVAGGAGGDPLLSDFAKLQAASLNVGKADFTEVENRLNDLMKPDNPWRHNARELLGLAALKAGKLDVARKVFETLLGDRDVPPSLRQRSQVLMANVVEADMAKKIATGGEDAKKKTTDGAAAKSPDKDASSTEAGKAGAE